MGECGIWKLALDVSVHLSIEEPPRLVLCNGVCQVKAKIWKRVIDGGRNADTSILVSDGTLWRHEARKFFLWQGDQRAQVWRIGDRDAEHQARCHGPSR